MCPDEIIEKHCVSNGWFCFTPPRAEIADLYPELTDRGLIRENIRQRCIYEIIGDLDDEWDDHMWWNYVYYMSLSCVNPRSDVEDECADKIMDVIGIKKEKVNKCIDESFGEPGDWNSYNNMLARDREQINDLGIKMNPTITINSHPYDGELRGEKVFAAICKAYAISKIPEVCSSEFDI